MSTLHAANGAQLLPDVGDIRAPVSSWVAYCCLNADHRRKHPVYADLAATLTIHGE